MNDQNSNFNNMNGVPDNSNNFNNPNGVMSNKVYTPPTSAEMANNGNFNNSNNMNNVSNMVNMNSGMNNQPMNNMNSGMNTMGPSMNGMNSNMNSSMVGGPSMMPGNPSMNPSTPQNNGNLPFFQMPEQEVMPPKEKSKLSLMMDKVKEKVNSKKDNSVNNGSINNNFVGSADQNLNPTPVENNQYVSGNVSFNPQMVNGQSSQSFNVSANQNTSAPVAPKRKFTVFGKKKNQTQMPSTWMNEQPLSMKSLGTSVLPDEKEVDDLENSLFFNPSAYEGNAGIVDRSMKVKTVKKKEKKYLENGSLVYNYLGDDYNHIAMVPFSMKGLLFGGLYLITHKVYLIGLLTYLFELYILLFMSLKKGLITLAIFVLVMAFTCNEIIYISAKLKVAIIRKFNSKKHEVQLVEIATRRGGTNFLFAVILFVVGLVFTGYTIFYKGTDTGMISSGINFVKLKVDEFLHPFIISFDSGIEVNGLFNVTMPEPWEGKDETIFSYTYREKYMQIDLCTFEFGQLRNYYDIDKFTEGLKKEYKIDDVKEVKVNKLNWKVAVTKDKDGGQTEYRYTTIDKKIFLMKSYTNQNDTTNVCKPYFDSIYNSVSKK